MFDDIGQAAASLLRQIAAIFGGGPTADETEPRAARIFEIEGGVGPAWGTLSGLTAHPTDPTRLFAVTDQDSPPLRILEIAVGKESAEVVRQIMLAMPGLDGLDTEALVMTPGGGFWLASEGSTGNVPPNLLIEVDEAGRYLRTVGLPPEIARRMPKKGFEGIALEPISTGERLVVAFQAPIDGDPHDMTRIATVDPATGDWRFHFYRLETTAVGDVTGLSEVLHLGGGRFAAIERDAKGGKRSIKRIATFVLAGRAGATPSGSPTAVEKHFAVDLVPLFLDAGRKVEKEIEGLAVAADGAVYVLTDNDNERPTLLLRVGPASTHLA